MAQGPSSSDTVTYVGHFQGMTSLQMQRLLYLEASLGLPCRPFAPEPQMQPQNADKYIPKGTACPILVRLPFPLGLKAQALLRDCSALLHFTPSRPPVRCKV